MNPKQPAVYLNTTAFPYSRRTLVLRAIIMGNVFTLVTACDANVAGVTFESGFMVDPAVSYQEGFEAGVTACISQKRSFSKYKSGTKTFDSYMEGWASGMRSRGCEGQL